MSEPSILIRLLRIYLQQISEFGSASEFRGGGVEPPKPPVGTPLLTKILYMPLFSPTPTLPSCLYVTGHIISTRIYGTTFWKCLKNSFLTNKRTNSKWRPSRNRPPDLTKHTMTSTKRWPSTESQPTRRRKEFQTFQPPHSGTRNTTCFPVNLTPKHLLISRTCYANSLFYLTTIVCHFPSLLWLAFWVFGWVG
jgi:hypothetical protein